MLLVFLVLLNLRTLQARAGAQRCADGIVLIDMKLPESKWVKICAGTLIRPTWILTAAGCLENTMFNTSSVYNVDKRPVKRIVLHPEYDSEKYEGNDVALMELEKPIGNGIVFLPKAQENILEPMCQKSLIFGWNENNEKCGMSSVVPRDQCKLQVELFPGQFCLNSAIEEAPLIEAGGPVLCGSVQVGVITSKWMLKANLPIVYTDLRSSVGLIEKTIEGVEERRQKVGNYGEASRKIQFENVLFAFVIFLAQLL
ncbi:unnamed protein product [Ceutorhynchus assimilis]|uniref:Peptidase S1 domain-containing protein n=1 Tax=Ceutorhynchus assimilis TaxID=467358 RepID=A0A9N9MWG4_9CUCU|nr:unnamed protein product [Ceutorhynchus assimilis]